MHTLANNNCLTCLQKLDADGQVPAAHPIDAELQRLLVQQLEWQPTELSTEWLPQQLCTACHQQLLNCELFQRQANACRTELLSMLLQRTRQEVAEKTASVFEIVYEEPAPDEQQLQPEQLLEAECQDNATTPPPPDPIDEPAMEEEVQVQSQQQATLEPGTRRRSKGVKNSFKCIQCGHSFAHSLTLQAHVRKVHEGSKRPFQCDRCDKAYSFMGGLYTHIKEIHSPQERSYRCDQPGCERVYISCIAMQKHKRLKHSTADAPARKYVCEQCGATFNQTANLKYHRRTKHPTADEAAANARASEQHFCDICQKHFHSRYTLKYHTMQQHQGAGDPDAAAAGVTMHECQVCGRRLAKRFMLVQHMLMHSAEKLPCEHCGRLFARKFELEAHIRAVHLKLKPFGCKYCEESFASRKTQRHHEYIHTGEKPYVCTVCGQAFRQQTCLKNHGRVHEKNK
ncbi:zinc finger protein 93 [Drosophila montana]|uniref:zinc finger protein 93 n=1 Tax=Drosophila montana TaxID=40370 RepID=UPI00313B9D4E